MQTRRNRESLATEGRQFVIFEAAPAAMMARLMLCELQAKEV